MFAQFRQHNIAIGLMLLFFVKTITIFPISMTTTKPENHRDRGSSSRLQRAVEL